MSKRRKAGGRAGARRHPRPREPALLQRIAGLADALATAEARLRERRFGLAVPEWRVVVVLGDGAPASLAEVAARGGVDRPHASRAAQALARRGIVERTHDAFDARRTLVRLTTKGRALSRRVALLARARERTLLAALAPSEQRELERLLAKVQRHATAALGPPAKG